MSNQPATTATHLTALLLGAFLATIASGTASASPGNCPLGASAWDYTWCNYGEAERYAQRQGGAVVAVLDLVRCNVLGGPLCSGDWPGFFCSELNICP